MELNHRLLDVSQASSPLDHGTSRRKARPQGLEPETNWVGTSHAANYTRHAQFSAEGEGLEPPSGSRRRLFSRQVPHPAGCLPLADKLRGLESNQL